MSVNPELIDPNTIDAETADELADEEHKPKREPKELRNVGFIDSMKYALTTGIWNAVKSLGPAMLKFGAFAGVFGVMTYGVAGPLFAHLFPSNAAAGAHEALGLIANAGKIGVAILAGMLTGGVWKSYENVAEAYNLAEKHNKKLLFKDKLYSAIGLGKEQVVVVEAPVATRIEPELAIMTGILSDKELLETPAYIKDIVARGSNTISPEEILKSRTASLQEFER